MIVQRMVDSQMSGVLFTANPTSGDLGEIVVCAAIGVGEGVVADRVDADTFLWTPPRWPSDAASR